MLGRKSRSWLLMLVLSLWLLCVTMAASWVMFLIQSTGDIDNVFYQSWVNRGDEA